MKEEFKNNSNHLVHELTCINMPCGGFSKSRDDCGGGGVGLGLCGYAVEHSKKWPRTIKVLLFSISISVRSNDLRISQHWRICRKVMLSKTKFLRSDVNVVSPAQSA